MGKYVETQCLLVKIFCLLKILKFFDNNCYIVTMFAFLLRLNILKQKNGNCIGSHKAKNIIKNPFSHLPRKGIVTCVIISVNQRENVKGERVIQRAVSFDLIAVRKRFDAEREVLKKSRQIYETRYDENVSG